MDENVITDLKQFIAATVSQHTSELKEDISGIKEDISGIKNDISGLRKDALRIDKKIDDLSASVAEALDTGNDSTESRLNDHERRIGRLEQRPA